MHQPGHVWRLEAENCADYLLGMHLFRMEMRFMYSSFRSLRSEVGAPLHVAYIEKQNHLELPRL